MCSISHRCSPGPSGFVAKMRQEPADYTITYYDATQVILDAIERVAKSGKPVNRDAMCVTRC